MKGYKLSDVYWIFGTQREFGTGYLQVETVLIPFVYNKEGTKIKTLNDNKIHYIVPFDEKIYDKDIRDYCGASLSIYDAEIITSSQLYSKYLQVTPRLFLSSTDASYVYRTDKRVVKVKVLEENFETKLCSIDEILKIGKKCKRALILFCKKELRAQERERRQLEKSKTDVLVEDKREF